MRANGAGEVEFEFHLCERFLQLAGLDPANHSSTLIADDIGLGIPVFLLTSERLE
jgi:hypothetical protein